MTKMRKANEYEWTIAVSILTKIADIDKEVRHLRMEVFGDTHPERYMPKQSFNLVGRSDFVRSQIRSITKTLKEIDNMIVWSENPENDVDEDGQEIETYDMQVKTT